MIPEHFALISESSLVSNDAVLRIGLSCNAQLQEDFYPIWQRRCDITGYASEADIPKGYWKVIIKDDIGEAGALGFHTDELGQPVAYVASQGGDINAVCMTVSHETLEAACDPYGNRLLQNILHPINQTERVQWLCELCDPPEAIGYDKRGLRVSDFICPEYFDDVRGETKRLTFLDSIRNCREVIAGGYCSFIGADNLWYQVTHWGSSPILEGPFHWSRKEGESLREMVDRETATRKPTPSPTPSPSVMQGIDCTNPATNEFACLQHNGQQFVIRYISGNTHNFPQKNLTREEGLALSQNGILLGAVWENLPADDDAKLQHFDFDIGMADARAAHDYMANVLQAPKGACIYFAIDRDTTDKQDKTIFAAYYSGVRYALKELGSGYTVGTYSGGATIQYLRDRKLIDFGWLTLSTGFRGSKGFTAYDIKQFQEKTVCGLDADTNEAKTSAGLFQLSAVETPVLA